MLVCPQCEYENPITNKFCEKCGTSLTHKTCHECNAEVPLSAERCPNCNALTDTVWWAIIANVAHQQPSPTVDKQPPQATASQPVASSTAATSAATLPQQESTSEQLE